MKNELHEKPLRAGNHGTADSRLTTFAATFSMLSLVAALVWLGLEILL